MLAGSPAFAPQVSKVLHPLHFLTVDQSRGCRGCRVMTGARPVVTGAGMFGASSRWRAVVAMGLVMLVGVVSFGWPFLAEPGSEVSQLGHGADASFIFVALMGLLGVVLLAELTSGGIDAKGIAVLGVSRPPRVRCGCSPRARQGSSRCSSCW